jgi:hypothetical protein
MLPEDLLIGQSPPAISSIRRNSDLVLPNQAVTITANIVDLGRVDQLQKQKFIIVSMEVLLHAFQ